MQLNRIQKIVLIIVTILLNIGCDQVSKEVVRHQMTETESIKVLSEYFILVKVENTGAFLGMGDELGGFLGTALLLVFPTALLVALLGYLILNSTMPKDHLLAFSCIIGGGLANLYDRFVYGSVTDFMHIDLGWVKSGIFNAADVSITMGFIYIILSTWLNKEPVAPTE